MKKLKFIIVLLILSMMFTQTVFSYEKRKTLKELVSSAPFVVVGKVLEVKSQKEKYLGQENFVMTYVKFSIQTFLKGKNSDNIITIKVPGGKLGDLAIFGEESFHFSKDEESVLFLTETDEAFYEIYSISGKLIVENKAGEKYLNCSLLNDDESAKYGPGSIETYDSIINRIDNYIKDIGEK